MAMRCNAGKLVKACFNSLPPPTSSDDDMQSTFSAVSTGQDSLQFDEEEEELEAVAAATAPLGEVHTYIHTYLHIYIRRGTYTLPHSCQSYANTYFMQVAKI